MSTPTPADTPTTLPPWTKEDADAMFASVAWLQEKAPPELIKQYEGMHIAILGEEIIDADQDLKTLTRRLDEMGNTLPNRVVIRYIPTEQEAWLRY
jgi:Family of unknown function (DUF5678)